MDIEKYINEISSAEKRSVGIQKKCYDFGDVVLTCEKVDPKLIKSRIENLKKLGEILPKLKVNSYKILGYDVVDGYLYVLETKVHGSVIHDFYESKYQFENEDDAKKEYEKSRKHVLKYISRLKQLNNSSILGKFFMDYISIIQNDVLVDGFKIDNFLFDGTKISFLNLSYNEEQANYKISDIVYCIMYIVSCCYSDDATILEISEISSYLEEIYKKLLFICKKNGYSISTVYESKIYEELISNRIRKFINCSKNIDDYIALVKKNNTLSIW